MERQRNAGHKQCLQRNGQSHGLWFWCLAIQWLFLPCILARCGTDNFSLGIYPEGEVMVLTGKSVELFCDDADGYKADDLMFGIGGETVPSEAFNSTTRRLYLNENQTVQGHYTYYCKNKLTNKVCSSRILVDTPPKDITDFNCKSKNLEVLNCTWTSPKAVIRINYSLTFFQEGLKVKDCQPERVGSTRYCSWNTTSTPRYRQQQEYYFFMLNFDNLFGKNQQNFTIDHYSIVKPSPPTNLKVIENGTHSVELQWGVPYNIMDFLHESGIEHKIEYQIAKIDNTSYFRSVNVSNLRVNKNKTYKFLLSDLPYAHMRYEVRIYIRPKKAVKDEYWSDFTYLLFYTASEKPRRPPDTAVGAFDQNSYNNKRRINVYWKQLEEYEEAGPNFTYKVVSNQGGPNSKTFYADNKKSLSYVVLEDASLGPINLYIWSHNNNGSSYNNSHLYIPPITDTMALRVTSFTKLAYENGTYKLSWVGIDKIDNYTIFWCQQNITKICTGRMNFIVLDPMKTNHVIDLPMENRYQFAISANNNTKTSGMVWAACDISKDGIPMYGFPVKLDHGAAGKSSVSITWQLTCTLQEGIITGYMIYYCPVKDVSNDCDPTSTKYVVNITNPKQKEINITDLKPYTTYQIYLSLNTTYGEKPIENASTRVTTTEDTPFSPRNITITQVESNSVRLSWDPPVVKNGIIGKYVIYNNGLEEYASDKVEVSHMDSRRNITIKGLDAFTNYSWSIAACNTGIGSCSQRSPLNGIFVRTKIGPPSKLKPPTILNNPDVIKWEVPDKPGGTVDLYQILRKRNQQEEIFNTTNLSYSLVTCEGGDEDFQVRAVNFDEDGNHGALADNVAVYLPQRKHLGQLEFPGEWSDISRLACRSKNGQTMTYIIIAVLGLAGLIYGSIKLVKKYRKMEDIKPVLPNGLGIPEKDISKYAFGGWNPTGKDEKPPSDEMLLLPNSRTTVSTDTKPKDESNCGASDRTDSTVLSDVSRGAMDRQASTSDECSDSSLHLEVEPVKDNNELALAEEDCSSSDTEVSHESSPYFNHEEFKKSPTSGYIQQPIVNPATGYVQSAPVAAPSGAMAPPQPPSSSYVMAGLPPPIFTTGVSPPSLHRSAAPSSGYVRAEDAQARSMNFPNHKSSAAKIYGPESLPIMPTLPTAPTKLGANSSYIQLQSLPNHKLVPVQSNVPSKAAASSGYVSPGDAVINKHLHNMLNQNQHSPQAEEPAILDPKMSPDAYCRFSWSTDPSNDNLHTLLNNPLSLKTNENLN